ncbi:ABC transporter permease [Paenibacillus abyssi]|uniref:Peptide ABC transporter permease n=1 Tax=Paenibacillus abyssi TaxID=1340531 RepID=A0A917FZ93_9BACL|nr:ABC transporter permease [Paenibacillus abyssi]GGG15033.1 peptide ABC transporter permease [Paenibacillus abyssi]
MDAKTVLEGTYFSDSRKELQKERRSLLIRRFLSNRMLLTGSVITVLLGIIALLAPFLTSYTPLEMQMVKRLQAPSLEHWFGTDNFGRDLFSRVVHGTRVSMAVGISVAFITMITGTVIGLYSAYYKFLDHILMRICDGLMAFPGILLAIALTAALGSNMINVIIALSIISTPTIARVVRSAAIVVKEQVYIEALRAQGASASRIIWYHMAPNTVSPLIIQITFVFAVSVLIEAALSFLGAGIAPPNPSLGNILYDGKVVIFSAWWMTVFPGLFILLSVLGLNLFGDGLRDMLDPHTNKAKK